MASDLIGLTPFSCARVDLPERLIFAGGLSLHLVGDSPTLVDAGTIG